MKRAVQLLDSVANFVGEQREILYERAFAIRYVELLLTQFEAVFLAVASVCADEQIV